MGLWVCFELEVHNLLELHVHDLLHRFLGRVRFGEVLTGKFEVGSLLLKGLEISLSDCLEALLGPEEYEENLSCMAANKFHLGQLVHLDVFDEIEVLVEEELYLGEVRGEL